MDNNVQGNFAVPTNTTQAFFQQPVEPKKKIKLWKKLLLSLIIISVIIGAGIYFLPQILSILFPGDAVLADQSEVRLQKISVPDSDNGFYDLSAIDASKDIYYPTQAEYPKASSFSIDYTNFLTPVKWNQQLVDEVLQKNQKALDAFNSAANKAYFQIPGYEDPANLHMDLKLFPMNGWREMARLQVIKALSLSWQGKSDEALQEAIKLNKLGHEMIIGHNSLIGTLVGMAIQNYGSQTIHQILPYDSSSKETLNAIQEEIKKSSDNLEGYKNAFRFEYAHIANSIDETINSRLSEKMSAVSGVSLDGVTYSRYFNYSYYYKPTQTKNLFTNLYNQEVLAVGTRCEINDLDERISLYSSQIGSQANSWKKYFTENFVGKLLYSVSGLALGNVITKGCQIDLAQSVVQTELALKEYKTVNGALPSSLNDLVPLYLSSVPVDPFDHQPMRYSAEKKILYSVGVNKKDFGGSEGSDWAKMDNPTFQIKF